MIRRVVGLLAGLFMFHLMLVGSDLACLTHGSHEAHARAVTHAEQSHHGERYGGEAPCDVPARADCCPAMTSCSTSITVRVVSVTVDALQVQDVPIAPLATFPRSRIEAPDPPPPKA